MLNWIFRVMAGLGGAALLAACDPIASQEPGEYCRALEHKSSPYTVCTFNAARDDIRLFLTDEDGAQYLQFETLAEDLSADGQTLVFAMNGGMYHEDRRPVGFLRDANGDSASVNTNDGPGNFHMKPNGVFWLDGNRAGVTESQAYLDEGIDPDFATQSGPMLVIDGDIHPSLNPDGTSRKRRNGVGVARNGETVFFVISDVPVTFHDFATLFKDKLRAPNALFLDGQVSRIYAPAYNRTEQGLDMGPIVGVVE